MKSAYKFVQKFWIMHKKIVGLINSKNSKKNSSSISEFTNQLIDKVTNITIILMTLIVLILWRREIREYHIIP